MPPKESLDFIRRETSHEPTLLNGRISWLVTCQSFLIAAYILILCCKPAYSALWLSHFLLPITGMVIAGTAIPGCLGACDTINIWRKRQYELLKENDIQNELKDIVIYRWLKDPNDDSIHKNSMRFSVFLAPFLLVFWLVLFILIWISPLKHIQREAQKAQPQTTVLVSGSLQAFSVSELYENLISHCFLAPNG